MHVEHLSPDAGPERAKEVLDRDGCVVIDRLAAPAVLDRVREEMAPHIEACPLGGDDFGGRSTRRIGALIARSETAREIVQHPFALGTASRVLGHATNYQLHLTQIIAIGPGESSQDIHRDQWAFDFFPFPSGYEVQCNTIWAMDDFTEENGATRVIPGSHRFADKQQFEQEDTIPAEMEKGSVFLYTGSVYHGGGANRSDRVRMGLNITYNLGFLRQEENQYLSCPIEVARTLPDELLRLMGYAMGAYALGYIDDARDPLEAVRATGKRKSVLGDTDAMKKKIRAEIGADGS